MCEVESFSLQGTIHVAVMVMKRASCGGQNCDVMLRGWEHRHLHLSLILPSKAQKPQEFPVCIACMLCEICFRTKLIVTEHLCSASRP